MSGSITDSIWWKINLSPSADPQIVDLLLELGAAGVEQTPTSLCCFLEASDIEKDLFIAACAEPGLNLISAAPVENRNWVQECSDLWRPVQIGQLSIVPFMDELDVNRQAAASEIFILPSTGFGTGHHESTRMALELMQHEIVRLAQPQTILDLGAGSGILALAAQKLFESNVTAVEIDQLSIENARINLRINNQNQISLRHGGVEQADKKYNLILANIYAEVLCELAPAITARAESGGLLIVSGILDHLEASVTKAYDNHWEILQVGRDGKWVSALLKLKN